MTIRKVNVSELATATELSGFYVFGVDSTNVSKKIASLLLKGQTGDSAYQIWLAQTGNAGKSIAEFVEWLRAPSIDAAAVAIAAKNETIAAKDVTITKAAEALASKNAAATSETNAAASAAAALTSKNATDTQAGIATTRAGEGAVSAIAAKASQDAVKISETNAAASAAAALTSKNATDTQAGIATTKAGEGAASAIAAKASQDAAKISETNAGNSETAALSSKNAAKASEDAAKISEDNSSAKASEASSASLSATSSKESASSSKSAADTAMNTAIAQAGIATTKAAAADLSAIASEAAKDDAVSAKDVAVSAKDLSVSAKDTAVSSAGAATTKAREALASANAAEAAKDDAVSAKDAAVSAKDTAVAQADIATAKADILTSVYIDAILSYSTLSAFPATGLINKIYKATDSNLTYRWAGTSYVSLAGGGGVTLGETSETAYRGDRGKVAYDQTTAHIGSGGSAHANSIASGAAGFQSGADKAKLDGIAAGATANDSDANLKNRANHTGTQLANTISDFASGVIGAVLTGLSVASSLAVAATDSILTAIGKLQAQITAHKGAGGSEHANAVAAGAAGFMTGADKTKLDELSNYTHPSTDGDHHVPATGTGNDKKVLKAGATVGSEAWGNVDFSELGSKPTTISGFGITDAYTKTDIGDITTDFVAAFNTAIA